MLYAGIQTQSGGWRSKSDHTLISFRGGIFSRWGENKESPLGLDYVEMYNGGACYSSAVADTSWVEGSFCSVRRPFAWTSGRYTFSLIKEETILYNNAAHSWVAYDITTKATNETTRIGRLLFEGEKLRPRSTFAAFIEVYGSTKKVPSVTVTFGIPKVNGIELPLNRVSAHRPHITPNITTITSEKRATTVVIDPCNPRPGPVSRAPEYFDFD